ncbi:TonB-dependent receptor plug domain-containing protein [Sphingomonas sp. M1-B02]|uniref:TonB-dependent receptor plug domain-containing protein n=1 Tax=Sphingomonas sp. M1-B02 TaxID=3114300 RepID=UPI002240DF57|nr:TonB-dependent receptor [Sphingomonas sp. S6-11]UZK65462.1 TonB-dependent receptor [Sphingomonas sp. S6-11]
MAQTSAVQSTGSPAEEAGANETSEDTSIVVTGSRIARAGFDQPTPTTVLGDVELRQGARPNIQQVLNDLPQVRPTVTPQVSVGNTSAGTAPVDLRGLGTARTLTLLNGRRFAGENNLNFVPISLVERLEVVTGGASAAWGSGAVAGVVNIILKDDLEGFAVGGQTGISSRGDGMRYGADASFGTSFAGGNGHFIVGAEYVDDEGIPDRNSRPNLGSAAIVRVTPGSLADLRNELVRDVNLSAFGTNQSVDGLITSGVLAGQVFNSDGTLRTFAATDSRGIGGEGRALYDDVLAATPFERFNAYARLSYDIGGAKVWIDGTYGRAATDAKFVPDFTIAPPTIQATNPFLSSAIRARLAAAGQTSFTLGRVYNDLFLLNFDTVRENKEVAVGIDGSFGGERFKYSAYYSHGEVESHQTVTNNRMAAQFANAINAVSMNGQVVCAINADASTANDDPACRPLNLFGQGNASAESIAYVRGTQQSFSTNKLDAAGVEVQGDIFSLWAGPVTVAVGAEARWEESVSTRDAATLAGGFGIPLFTSDLAGGFNVKEAFGEIALPLLDVSDTIRLDVNGAARYSDYSNSGGIWSWKVGGTARLFDDLLLRATKSRDIRSPGIGDLFSVRRITVGALVDRDTAGRAGVIPGYNATPATVTTYSGGNPDLQPEIGKTLTIGASYAPSFMRGFNVSVDYYDIEIEGAIATLSAANLTFACSQGNQAACDRITRDPTTQTVVEARANAQNVASVQTRGVDVEMSYLLQMSQLGANMGGSLRFRALATYVDRYIQSTGVPPILNTAGDVGDAVALGLPKWRGTFGATYQDSNLGFDARVRYVDGGKFNQLLIDNPATVALEGLINNEIKSRTYVDLGIQFKVLDSFTLSANVNNVFDVAPPISTAGNPHYDIVGTYFSMGARVKF